MAGDRSSGAAAPAAAAGVTWTWALAAGAVLALAWGAARLPPLPQAVAGAGAAPGSAALFAIDSERPLLVGPHGRIVPQADAGEAVAPAPHRRAASDPQALAAPARPAPAPALSEEAARAMAEQACKPLLPRLPGIKAAQCAQTRLVDSGARSVNGMPLYWRDVPPPPRGARGFVEGTPLQVLVVGAMHGDELTAASLALRWIALAESQALPTRRPVHWRFIPVLNPDGMLAKKPTRVNARGVDLNRNFPTPNWERDAPIYWDKRTRKDPRRWPGPTPLSEPESQFLHAQMAQFDPDLVVSIHAPYGVLDFDGPQPPPSRLGRLRLDQLGVFPGSLGHYGSVHLGLPVVTIELQHELKMPQDDEVRTMWRDLLRWMDRHLAEP